MLTRAHPADWPAGPPGHPLLGNLSELSRNWLDTLTHYAREYGDFVPLRLGPKRAVLVSHPTLVEDVLVTRNRAFVKSLALRNSRRIFGDGLVTSEGEHWLAQRRLIQPALHHQHIPAYGRAMVECTLRMLAGWRAGETRELYADFSRLTLEIVTQTLFGAAISAGETADVAQAVAAALAGFDRRINSLLFLVPDTVPLPGHLGYLRAAQRLDEIVYRIIERARSNSAPGDTLLELLLNCRDDDGRPMTDRQLRDELLSLMVAGHETTALTLMWVFVLLAQHPAVETTLIGAVDTALEGQPPSTESLARLQYVDWVVKETLRLYPTSWVIARESIEECSIGPFRVDPGTVMVMSQWVIHRDARFFDDADTFRPERWLDSAQPLPRFAYFPFGGGPRVCIGNAFAGMELVLVLATIAQQFRLTLAPDQSVEPHPSATLRPDRHLRVVLCERGRPGASSR
jgi:cytochrome P450